jgi:hypothetical protein
MFILVRNALKNFGKQALNAVRTAAHTIADRAWSK